MFPVDTIKTLMQVRGARSQLQAAALADGAGAAGSSGGMSVVVEHLRSQGGMLRMWRGVQTMFSGCVPAHAAYFSIYEGVKARLQQGSSGDSTEGAGGGGAAAPAAVASDGGASSSDGGASSSNDALAAGVAVALATMCHDVIMTPMDCIKQRLQLGHHRNSVVDCACHIVRSEGLSALMLAYPTTLLMNVPYALIMGSTNEAIRESLNPSGGHSLATYLVAGAGGGAVAAALTNPLDVVKTRLQTQHLRLASASESAMGHARPAAAKACVASCGAAASGAATAAVAAEGGACPRSPLAYTGMLQAAQTLLREEGPAGFSRGMRARVLIHAPSVAICWTTYESVKHLLVRLHLFE